MEKITRIESVTQYNALRGAKTLHPMITLLDLSQTKQMPALTLHFGLYAIFLKEVKCGELKYGRSHYDYQEGTMVFIGPGQVVGVQPGTQTYLPKGWALLFHPELIRGTSLGNKIREYSFFSYDVNEALHISDAEREIVLDCFTKLGLEIRSAIDKHSRTLIASNLELLLNYCTRFYDRQFIIREQPNKGILERFEALVDAYYATGSSMENGLPSVAYFADALHLSANYFGDLVRRESGITAQEYIQKKVIDLAKEKIFDREKSISEVAYELGFRYPQHFTRLFKQKVGMSPNAYRTMGLN